MGAPGIEASATQENLRGKRWHSSTLENALNDLKAEMPSLLQYSRQLDPTARQYQASVILASWGKVGGTLSLGLKILDS